jgi:glycosyltransferase involved in cell wall biosynthesis
MKLINARILYIAYPLLTVSEESAGGAEQMLWTLEREMAAYGVSTTVAASAGSRISGELFATGDPCILPDDFERRNREHQNKAVELINAYRQQGRAFDLVHDQSGSFWPQAANVDASVLATLHLPRHFYPGQYFENVPANVSFNCVSESQARSFSDLKVMIGVVSNGILLDRFRPYLGVRKGLLWLGRICEEKGTHLALEIAERAGVPITIAGPVYPFTYHQQYFEREVAPRLQRMPNAAFISSLSAEQKHQLLRQVRAVLITSLVDETSSLVAMEAAACGTPVIAFNRGALPEVVKDGVTGFLVDNVEDAILALANIDQIKPEMCAKHAQAHFSSREMAERYGLIYNRIREQVAA